MVCARDLYFTGNTVIIDHGLGVFSMLAHLSRLDVKEGDTVQPSQILGLVGATGRVTGPHLHWALSVSGARVDPLSALALLGNSDTNPGTLQITTINAETTETAETFFDSASSASSALNVVFRLSRIRLTYLVLRLKTATAVAPSARHPRRYSAAAD